jgi:hypothetical protein
MRDEEAAMDVSPRDAYKVRNIELFTKPPTQRAVHAVWRARAL